MSRVTPYVVSVLAVAAVAYPAVWPYARDSFPLSHYPMFSRPRPRTVSLATVVGVDEDGTRHTLTPEQIGGTPWVNMAVGLVRDAVARGGDASAALCRDVAVSVASSGPPWRELEVVTETFDSVAYFTEGQTGPRARNVHARCKVVQ